ncbi:MAG: type III secretion system outer membrane ring subunit SctC [Kiritimatiellae bacterium]|nr:type III secretion system outer membrane ring subunit SctC [Kiritimatiellia bacterium]
MKKLFIMLAAGLSGLVACAVSWRTPTYTLTARLMDVREALTTFGVAQGLPVILSEGVRGSFSGTFKDIPAPDFLDKVATLHNLVWYCDGATIFIYSAAETTSELFDLTNTTLEDVRRMLHELGLDDARYPIKSTKDSNVVLVSGPPRYVQLVGQTIARAEQSKSTRARTEVVTRVFRLRNAWADNISFSTTSSETSLSLKGVATLLEEIVSSMDGMRFSSTSVTNAPGTDGGPAVQAKKESEDGFVQQPVIRAENRLNAVVIRDVASRMPMYESLIKELDVAQPLVEIGVTVIELSKDDALDWGLSVRAGGSSRHLNGAAGQNVDSLMNPNGLEGKGISGALTFLRQDWDLEASLAALRTKGKARNITRTSLLTANNLAAEMSDKQTYHVRVVGERTATLQDVSAGMDLRLKPRIVDSTRADQKDQIWLSIDLTDGGIVDEQDVDAMPLTRSSKVVTQAGIYEGESLLLAGNLRDVKSKAGWGVPWLRDLPWVGWLFGGLSVTKETVQRMFVITPRKISMDQDNIARIQATRQRDISDAEAFEKDAEDSDNAREIREQENKAQSERRREETEDRLRRRKAEIQRDVDQRHLDRVRERRRLDEDCAEWKADLEAAKKQLKEEDEAREAAKNPPVKMSDKVLPAPEPVPGEKKAVPEKK